MRRQLRYFRSTPQPEHVLYNGIAHKIDVVWVTLDKKDVSVPDYLRWRAQNRIYIEDEHILKVEVDSDGRL